MALQSMQKLAIPCIPQLDVIIKSGASDEQRIWRKSDVVDLFLMPE